MQRGRGETAFDEMAGERVGARQQRRGEVEVEFHRAAELLFQVGDEVAAGV